MRKITWFIDSYGRVRIMDGHYDLDSDYPTFEAIFELLKKCQIGIIASDTKEEEAFFMGLGYEREVEEISVFFLCDEWGNEEVTEEFLKPFIQ